MIEKRDFHLEIVLEIIAINIIFNPNIQTNNKGQKQPFNPKFPDKKSRKY